MSQQIYDDNLEQDNFVLEAQESTSTSKDETRAAKLESDFQEIVVEKKSFSERWKTNRFWLVRGSFHVLKSVWMVAVVIGGFIAWLISLLFI